MRSIILFVALLACALLRPSTARAHEASADAPGHRAYTATEVEDALVRPLALEDCIGIALARNLSLRVTRADLGKAEKTLWGSYGRYLPKLSVVGSRQHAETTDPGKPDSTGARDVLEGNLRNQRMVGGLSQTLPTGATVNVSRDLTWAHTTSAALSTGPTLSSLASNSSHSLIASVTQPILRGGPSVAWSPVSDADFARRSQEKLVADAARQTVHQTRLAYYEVLRAREVVRIDSEALAGDSSLVDASEAMLLAKMATRRDILSAQIRQADDRASVVSAEKDLARALDQLKDVMGIPLEAEVAVVDSPLTFHPVELDADDLIRRVAAGNPALEAADFAVSKSKLQLKVARNATLPSLDVSASYSRLLDRDHAVHLDSRENDWGAGFTVSYPFLSRDGTAAAELARLDLAQQEDRRAIVQRKIVLDVRDAVRSLRSIAEEITAIQRSIEAAGEKLDFATAMFNLGRASNLDITDAREALLKSRNQYLSRLADYHGQLSVLESLTGLPLAE